MNLQVTDGEFNYPGGRTLFVNVSFELPPGEILAILGPNGAGKTTLLKCITGLLGWKKGGTLIDGKPLNSWPADEVWKHISYVPQARSLVFSYTVREMVLMGRAPFVKWFSLPTRHDVKMARWALKKIGIEYLMDKSCSEISGGELQMVLIARALASEPHILVLDEPESHLDFRNQILVLDILEKLAREQKISCIINTHYPEHALRLADQTLILGKDGRHIVGNVDHVVTEDILRDFFGVNVKIIVLKDRERQVRTVLPLTLTMNY